ncbi:MAG: response regulator [Magnetovibrionaceae bacterium]
MKAYDLSGINVLLLEKHVLIRRLISDMFSVFGVPVVHATNSPEAAWEMFREYNPDLVLTDWNAEIDGMTLLHRIRLDADTVNPYCPVVVVTANTELRHVCTARDRGMTEFLAKPVSAKVLYARIVSVIETNRMFVRSSDFFGPDRRRMRNNQYGGQERRVAT